MGDKKRRVDNSGKGGFKIIFIILIIFIIVLSAIVLFYFFNKQSFGNTQNLNQVVLENPMKKIVERNLNPDNSVNPEKVIEDGIKEFNENYINYLLLALGVDKLHSFPGFGNPVVELMLDNEVWSSEISEGALITKKMPNENLDLRFTLSKEEAVKALLSSDMKQFMKDSVANGRTQIEMIAGKPELLAKGYLDLYNAIK
jgi:hypothetical protein